MISHMLNRYRRALFVLPVLLMLMFPTLANAVQAPDSAETLLQKGIAALDNYKRHFYKTGDQATLLPELEKAAGALTRSYNTFVEHKDFAAAALSSIKLGDIERSQAVVRPCKDCEPVFTKSRYDTAYQRYFQARVLAKRVGHLGYETKALAKLAYTDGLGRGNLSAGMDDVQEAIRLATKAGNRDDLADALNTAATLELKRGNFNAAEDYLGRILAIKEQITDRVELYFAYSEQGDLYLSLGMQCLHGTDFGMCHEAFSRSRASYEQAAETAAALGYEFLVDQGRSSIHDNLDVQEALVHRRETSLATVAGTGVFHPKEAKDVLVTQNFAAAANPKALAAIQSFLKVNPGITLSPDPIGAYVQGMLSQMAGNSDAALDYFLRAVDLLEQDRRKLHDEQSRVTFLEDKIDIYYAAILQLLQRNRLPDAFGLLERSRSRAMADLMTSRGSLNLGRQKEQDLLAESLKLKAETALEQQKLFQLTLATGRAQAAKIRETEARVTGLQQEYSHLEERIGHEAPRLKELLVSVPVSLTDAQRSAAEGNYDLIYYHVLDHAVILWHISGTDVEVFNVFLPQSELIGKVAALRDSLVAPAHESTSEFNPQMSRELFLYLIQPVLQYVKQRHLVIVPHGVLNSLPFQVLQNPATNTFLGEQYQISYVPSATVLAKLKQQPNLRGARLLALANPEMHDAVAEVRTIGDMYPGRSKVIWKTFAGKAQLKAWVNGYDVVHLSVHGVFDETDPLLSRVELAPEANDDGRLTAAEMFGLSLAEDSLVVLSACETGRVQSTHASEVVGIERALFYAGANDMVLSSWEVKSNATAIWMQTFYQNAQKKPLNEAARLALLAVKRDPNYQHPYFWAPFLLIGK